MLTSRRLGSPLSAARRVLRGPLARLPLPASVLHAPRAVVVKRLALAVVCCGTLSVAGFVPVHAATSRPTGSVAAALPADRGIGGTRVSRDEQRGTPSAAPSSSAPAAPAPSPSSAAPSPAAPSSPAPPAVPTISGLDQYQAENAQTIVKVGSGMGVSTRGKVIAIATALQESKLYNLDQAVDYDSLGLFQQRPSTGWGTPAEITTPSYAAQAFYRRLLDTQYDWGCLTCAAQRVQGSAFPYAYAQWEGFADSIVAALGG